MEILYMNVFVANSQSSLATTEESDYVACIVIKITQATVNEVGHVQ